MKTCQVEKKLGQDFTDMTTLNLLL